MASIKKSMTEVSNTLTSIFAENIFNIEWQGRKGTGYLLRIQFVPDITTQNRIKDILKYQLSLDLTSIVLRQEDGYDELIVGISDNFFKQ